MSGRPPTPARGLLQQARSFAHELTASARAVAGPNTDPFRATAVQGVASLDRFVVRQGERTGIVLTVDKAPTLRLEVDYRCVWDHRRMFLAVETSYTKVSAFGATEPLFRYDYNRSAQSAPAAHFQIHAHRDAISYTMANAGAGSSRSRARAKGAGRRIPQLSDLHFTLGGHRFRPCLEDILEMLIDEFGVDAPKDARETLADGRERWRIKQVGASVRDAPKAAVDVLESLGYAVTPPATGRKRNRRDRLRAY